VANRALKIAIALSIVLTPPAASFARGGHGGQGGFAAPRRFGRNGKCADQWHSARPGERWWNEQYGGRSQRIGNAAKMATLPQPHIAARRSRMVREIPPAPPSMNVDQQALPEHWGEGVASRAPIKCHREKPDESERSINRENAAARPHDQWHLSRVLSNGLFP